MQPQSQPSSRELLVQLLHGHWISQALYVAAKLKLADLLAFGPRTVADLAAETQTNERCLFRLLRTLASLGIFLEQQGERFTLTPLAEGLRSDLPDSQWALAVMAGEEAYFAWGHLLHSVKTGETGFVKQYGRPIFDYLADHPEQAAIFDRAMTGVHGHETQPMIDAYPFGECQVLADLGGGNGSVLSTILTRHPNLQGILFDLPHVVERTRPRLAAAGLANRCQALSGSFFESVPQGADAYLMRHIVHDWNDEQVVTILRNCRAVLPERGRVLVVENIVLTGNAPSPAKLLDLAMMVLPGGLERTEAEYRALFDAADLKLTRVVPTTAGVSVLEARAK